MVAQAPEAVRLSHQVDVGKVRDSCSFYTFLMSTSERVRDSLSGVWDGSVSRQSMARTRQLMRH